MRIAHLLWSFSTGGIENMLVDIVNEQIKAEQVAIFVINNRIDDILLSKIDKRVKIYLIGRKEGSKNPFFVMKFNYYLYLFKADIIHTHSDSLTYLVWGKYHFVRTIHNTHSSGSDYIRCERLFCISNSVRKYTEKQGFPNGMVIYNGIHCDNIASNEHVRENLHSPVRIVCVGRLNPMKGQDVLVEAIRILVNERGIKNISLDLIGDGELRTTIEDTIQRNSLQEYICLLGAKSREFFYAILKDYDLFVIPSVNEGFGLTLAEACAAKIPVITTDLDGPLEVIDYGKYGRCFKCGDSMALANEIESFLRVGVNVQQVKDAYCFVREHFDVVSTTKKYLNEYQKIIC